MMHKKKSLVALLAAFFAAISLLAACGQAGGPARTSSDISAASLPQSASTVPNSTSPAGSSESTDTLAARMVSFAASTAPALLAGDENACYSPASLYLALALVSCGAEGETLAQLEQLLQLQPGEDPASGVARFMQRVQTSSEARKLSIQNASWLAEGYELNDDFAKTAQDEFDALLATVPFGTPETDAQISKWVSDATDGLLSPSIQTDADALLYLINTILYIDNWSSEFDPEQNTEEPFTLTSGDKKDCTFMHRSWEGDYYPGDGWNAVTLPLTYGSMTFVLPDEGTPAADLLASPKALQTMASFDDDPSELAQIILKLPKFSFDSKFEPISALKTLGVTDAFDDSGKAQFPNLCKPAPFLEANPPYISNIIQETHIAIDEEGIEAAAYTEVVVAPTAAMPTEPPPTVELFFDRPFLFFLTASGADGAPLFVGVVNDPTI